MKDLKKAFPLCDVRVSFKEGGRSDTYHVASVGDQSMKLVAFRPKLSRRLPAVGESIFIMSTLADAAYQIYGRVVQRKVGDYVVLVVERSSEVERIQRRRNFRVSAKISVKVQGSDEEKEGAAEEVDLVTEDVSAGGIRVLRSMPMARDELVKITMDLGEYEVACDARVVRCLEMEDGDFEVGMTFEDLSEQDKDRVIRTLMQIMRQMVRSSRRISFEPEGEPTE